MTCEVRNKEINSQCAELLVRPLYMMHMSEFVFCQTQISMSHISANENNFHLKF